MPRLKLCMLGFLWRCSEVSPPRLPASIYIRPRTMVSGGADREAIAPVWVSEGDSAIFLDFGVFLLSKRGIGGDLSVQQMPMGPKINQRVVLCYREVYAKLWLWGRCF